MMKILHLEIDDCNDCPYQKFEPNDHTFSPREYVCRNSDKPLKEDRIMTENEYYGYGKMSPPAWCPIPNKEEMKTGVKSISITDIPSGVVCGWCWCNMNEHRVVHTSDRGIKQYRCVLCKRVCV